MFSGNTIMRTCSKVCTGALLVLMLIGSSGCTTYNTIQYAKGHSENVAWFTFSALHKERNPDEKPQPAYYLLTPVTVPVDVATFPIQFVDFWMTFLGGRMGQNC